MTYSRQTRHLFTYSCESNTSGIKRLLQLRTDTHGPFYTAWTGVRW